MKFLPLYRIGLIAVLAVSSPLVLRAGNRSIDKPVKKEFAASILSLFQDSGHGKKSKGNPREQGERPSQDAQNERIREVEKRSIKEVPRSTQKLKPQPVPDRAKMSRPSIKVRGKN